MGHPNLSPALNSILDATKSPDQTLDLHTVQKGDVVELVLGEGDLRSAFSFQIDTPAEAGFDGKPVIATVLSCQFGKQIAQDFGVDEAPFPIENKKIELVASCTKNESSPLGMTMVAKHRLTKGRNLLWGVVDWPNRWVLFEAISNWELKRA